MGIVNRIFRFWSAEKHIRSLALAIFYVVIYDYVYRNFVDFFFSYALKEKYYELHGMSFVYYVFIASSPFMFFKGVKTVAASFSLFTYLLAYIPIINAILAYPFSFEIKQAYTASFFICMCMFFMTDKTYLFAHIFKTKRKLLSFQIIYLVTFVSLLLLLLLNSSQMTFVNFFANSKELYKERAINNLNGVYLLCWLRGCFLPLIMVKCLKRREYIQYLFVFVAFVLIFMMDKQKITLVFPFVLTALYWVTQKTGNLFTQYFHSFLMLFISIVAFIMVVYISYSGTPSPVIFSIAALFIMRTVCIEGMEAQRYLDFFIAQDHPYTYYGHVNIINALTGIYPYSQSIGQTVGGGDGNANATFWLMDGVAAYGLLGIFVISIFFIVFKSIMNSADVRCSVPIYVCITLQGITSMMNVSLFTSINSSGLLLLFFILLLVDTKDYYK